MDNLLYSIYHYVDSPGTIETGRRTFEPVRIAILDSGFDPGNPLLMTDDQRLDPRIKDVRSFVHQTEPLDIQDRIGHGTHALGLLLKVATCAEVYIGRIASQETLGRGSYDDIAKVRLAHTLCYSKDFIWANSCTGYQLRGHRMECRHYIDVIRNSGVQRGYENSHIECITQSNTDVRCCIERWSKSWPSISS